MPSSANSIIEQIDEMASNNDGNNNLHSIPCLDWLNSPVNQVLAIAALARLYDLEEFKIRFYDTPEQGRAGLLVSVLYKVCGRMLDPENGMEGLFRSGHWEHSYHAVRAFVRGERITPLHISNPSYQMGGRSTDQAQSPMTGGDGGEVINPSRPCSTSEGVGPSGINQPQSSLAMNPKEDEISLELTLGRPEYRKM